MMARTIRDERIFILSGLALFITWLGAVVALATL